LLEWLLATTEDGSHDKKRRAGRQSANRQVGERRRVANSEWSNGSDVGLAISHDSNGSEWRIATGDWAKGSEWRMAICWSGY
jgi:hypothetical protein